MFFICSVVLLILENRILMNTLKKTKKENEKKTVTNDLFQIFFQNYVHI